MNTENEKRLDDLFKKKLEDPVDEIRYEEGDWDALTQLLDKPRRKRIVYLWPILSGIAAMLLIFLGWWAFRPKTGGRQSGNPVQMAAHAKKDTIIDNKAIAGPKKPDTIIDNPQSIAAQKQKDTIVEKAIAGKKAPAGAANKVQGFAHENTTAIKSNVQKQALTPVINNNKNAVALAPVKKDTIIDKANKTNKVSSDAMAINQSTVTKPATTIDKPAATTATTGLAVNTPAKPKTKPQMAYRPRYTLSVVAAPDLNGVGSFAQSKVGTNIGMTFAVGLSKKITVSTGALYSVKPYATNFNNYRNGAKWPVSPQEVTADCRMLDIPLNVSYQVYHRGQNKFSLGTGLSSYIMLHESYKFEYASNSTGYGYGGAPGPSNYTVPGTSKYFFGVVNLNATYEHQINSKVGISIQPYMKLPLSNIGYSQVKLQTTGVAVGLSWNLNSLTKP